VGIVTHGDLVRKGGLTVRLDLVACLEEPERRALLERLGSGSKVAADVMTPSPVTVDAGAPLPQVAELMSHRRLKRLPVVDARGGLAGMVSRVDLLRTAAAGTTRHDATARELGLTGDALLARVMRRDVPTVRPETPLPEVFQAIVATRLNRVLVVDADRRVLGLVTDAELLDRLTPALRPGALRSLMHRLPFGHAASGAETPAEQHARARTASELMTTGVPQVTEGARLGEAIALMLEGQHKVLAVTDAEGRLTGMVDRADLLHGLVQPP
jgi:CBS domain-containing protein